MAQTPRTLAIIPARGGSKRIPNKNIRPIAGKPLIAWTIDEARRSSCIDRLIVSTDSPAIAEVARGYGAEVPFMRPAELATDETSGTAPVLHAVQEVGADYDLVVLLQPTSPLRIAADIDACIAAASEDRPSIVSVCEPFSTPFHCYTRTDAGLLEKLIDLPHMRMQDYPEIYCLNGAVFLARKEWLMREERLFGPETYGCVMPQERSLDIDTELDFKLCEFLLSERSRI